jgi:hypothetical protein
MHAIPRDSFSFIILAFRVVLEAVLPFRRGAYVVLSDFRDGLVIEISYYSSVPSLNAGK